MIGASNIRQQARLWKALGRLDMVKINNNERDSGFIEEKETLKDLLSKKTAIEWEEFFIKNKVPASRVRTLPEALADTQLDSRNLLYKHENANGIKGEFSVPVSAFKFSHGGAKVTSPPPVMGINNTDILIELGYSSEEIDGFKLNHII
jgi:crotonobetainyl-CoA:carnitine CoA-transferase CaiB-like acyl-CoA transferase